MTDIEENCPRTAAIITDSRISLDSIKNIHNHSYLIEEIRERLSKLERSNWTVAFTWVKTHEGNIGNELADRLGKTAARDKDKTTSYSSPLSTLYRELEEESKLKWQQNWEESSKAAQTKQFYPSITDRLKSNIDITSNFTGMVSGQLKQEPIYPDLNYWKVQHVLATREIRLTTCYTIAPYFDNKGKYLRRIH
jgi:hypothetical protein